MPSVVLLWPSVSTRERRQLSTHLHLSLSVGEHLRDQLRCRRRRTHLSTRLHEANCFQRAFRQYHTRQLLPWPASDRREMALRQESSGLRRRPPSIGYCSVHRELEATALPLCERSLLLPALPIASSLGAVVAFWASSCFPRSS